MATTYTFDLGAGGTRVLVLDKNECELDGVRITQLEAVEFLQGALLEGVPYTKEEI